MINNKSNPLIFRNRIGLAKFISLQKAWYFRIDNGSLFEETKIDVLTPNAYNTLMWLAHNVEKNWYWTGDDDASTFVIIKNNEVDDIRNIVYVAINNKADAMYFKLSNTDITQINIQDIIPFK